MAETTLIRTCRKCGASMFPEGTEGYCGACLLETGLFDDDQETASKSASTLLDFGDYELLEEIGRGGQGVVYRARQKGLNRIVALKILGMGHWASDAHLKRFRLEAVAAAGLDHPGIVPIYDVGERDGSCYFSMKLVEGGQLDEIAGRDPLPIRRAVELAMKLARTVHYAHERGILHRDIKPGNILLDASGESHLTDFGLARLVEKASTVTHSHDVMGTPSFMAPEQASGQMKEVSRAADIYGLGAVFYQMLTGHPPFAGGTTYETIRLVMETEPRRPSLWNSKVDRDLETIALKCLAKEPAKRYESAEALAEDLERWFRHEPIRARRSGILTRSRKWVRRKPALAAVTPLVIALAAVLGMLFWKSLAERPAPASVAVLPFENLSERKEDAPLADGLQDDILTKLAKVADLRVISRTSVMQYRGERNVRKIGQALRVSHVLEGSVRKTNGSIRVNAQLIDTHTDTHVWAQTYDRPHAELFALEAELAEQIAARLNSRVSSAEKSAMERKPTHDLQAYGLYLRAKELIRTTSPMRDNYRDQLNPAIALLEEAVTRDPGFALAWCLLTEARLTLYWVPSKPSEQKAKAEAALQMAMRLAPNAGETNLAHALYFYWGQLDYDRALEKLEAAARSLPNSAEVYRLSARVERRLGRWKDALRHSAKAVELDPHDPNLWEDLIQNNNFVRRHAEAIRLAHQAIVQCPEAADRFTTMKGHAALGLGDLKTARAAVDALSENGLPTLAGFLLRFDLALMERNYDEAAGAVSLREQLSKREFLVPDSIFVGLVARMRGDMRTATAEFLRGRDEIETRLRQVPNVTAWIAQQAIADAALGRRDDALRAINRALELEQDPLNRQLILLEEAIVYCWLGEREQALAKLEALAAVPHGVTHGDLRFNPAWDSLRDDPRFTQIVADVAVPLPLPKL